MIKRIVFILIILLHILIASAQTDTITYGECEIDTIPTQYDKLLKYFMVEKELVNHLWKFNAVDWGSFNPSIAFEQRILKRSSVEFESIITTPKFSILDPYEDNPYQVGPQFKFEINADYRFYFNKKKREKLGKSTNGFSANYIFLGGGVSTYNRTSHIYANYGNYDYWDSYIDVKTGMGIQRRIGSIGYVDIKFGGYTRNKLDDGYASYAVTNGMKMQDFFIDINLGLALRAFKKPLFK